MSFLEWLDLILISLIALALLCWFVNRVFGINKYIKKKSKLYRRYSLWRIKRRRANRITL